MVCVMELAAYETWMALEECEKYRLIRKERSDEIRAALVDEGVMHTSAMMAQREWEHGWVWPHTLKKREAVMHVMALEQYEKCLAVAKAVRIKTLEEEVMQGMARTLTGPLHTSTTYLEEANLDVANTYNKIAGVYKTQGKRHLEMAYLPVLGLDLLDNASVADVGKYEMALVHYEKCLAIRINVLGENHVDVCNTQLNIAEVHEAVCRANMMRCRAITAVHSVARHQSP